MKTLLNKTSAVASMLSSLLLIGTLFNFAYAGKPSEDPLPPPV